MSIDEDIVDAATEVHGVLGSGCSESTYHRALEHEFSRRGIPFTSETTVPILYKGMPVGKRRPDMIVSTEDEKSYAVELKAGSNRGQAQLFNYIDIIGEDANFDLSGGILIRFNDDLEVVKSGSPKDL